MIERLIYAGHVRPVFKLQASASGSHFLSHGLDETTRLWETFSVCQIDVFSATDTLIFSPGGAMVVHGGDDGFLCLREVATLRELRRFAGHMGAVRSVAVSPDGKQILSGGDDGTLRLWDLDSGLELYREKFRDSVTGVDFSWTGDSALCCLGNNSVLECDLRRGQVSRYLVVTEQDEMNGIAYSPGGSYGLYSGSFAGIIDLCTGREMYRIPCEGMESMMGLRMGLRMGLSVTQRGIGPNLAFSKDDHLMATGHTRGIVEIWQIRPRKSIRRIETGATGVYCVAFSPNDDKLLCATDRSMNLFQVANGEELCRFPATPSPANWAAFLPADKGIVTAHGRLVIDETGQRGLQRDGEYVYHDNVVRLWSTGGSSA